MERQLFKEEHEVFRQGLRKYIQTQIKPKYADWEKAAQVPREIWLDAGKHGWLCPEAPMEYGGNGGDFLYSVIVSEEIFYHGYCGVFWPLHNDMVFPYLMAYGNEAQKQLWVPKCTSGECILAVAMTEPNAGSDLASLQTSAKDCGDHYLVNGSKTFISNGQIADLFVVAVRTERASSAPHRGISLLLIEASNKGLVKGRNLAKIGMHAQDTSEIFFEDCQVPKANLLGEEGLGFKYLMRNLQQERLTLAIGAVAAARGAFDLTLEHIQAREMFGRKLSQFQHTRFQMAEMATQIQISQSFIDDLIGRHTRKESLVKEVSMAKYWVSDMQFQIADRCLQMFGGYGYMSEYPISRYFLDARVQRIYGGANEVMKELIARELGLN